MLGALLKVVQFFLQLVYDKFLYIKYTVVKYEGGGGLKFFIDIDRSTSIHFIPSRPSKILGGFRF